MAIVDIKHTQTIEDSLKNLSEIKKLPEVTAEDNGKVLSVVEGEWAKAEASGGGGITLVDVVQFIPSGASAVAAGGDTTINTWSMVNGNGETIDALYEIGDYNLSVIVAIDPNMNVSSSDTRRWSLLGYKWYYEQLTIRAKNLTEASFTPGGAWAMIAFYKVG